MVMAFLAICELNNTGAGAAPVSLAANSTVNGTLTLSQDKLFNIGTYNLKLNAASSIVNGGALRYIQTAGNAGDGGLTRVYTSPAVLSFPVGVVNYTPGSVGFWRCTHSLWVNYGYPS